MSYPGFNYIDDSCNVLLWEELSYDKDKLKKVHDRLYSLMNDGQYCTYQQITDTVIKDKGGVFFVYGYGGIGKTFMWKTLFVGLRSQGRVILNVASSGLASVLLEGGTTANSRFRIPNVNEYSFCTIASHSDMAGLLRNTDLIIWDEAPTLQRHCFEAFEITLRDVVDLENDIESIKDFVDWILQIGEGNLGGPIDGEVEIELPDNFLVKSNGDHVESISNTIYPSINDNHYDLNFLRERAILAPTNEEVEFINDFMISKIDGEEVSYYSSDSICSIGESDTFEESLKSPELLNSIKVYDFPSHKLNLKVGVNVMMLRNLEQSKDLCNRTRLQVTRLSAHVVKAKIIAGKNVGHITHSQD